MAEERAGETGVEPPAGGERAGTRGALGGWLVDGALAAGMCALFGVRDGLSYLVLAGAAAAAGLAVAGLAVAGLAVIRRPADKPD